MFHAEILCQNLRHSSFWNPWIKVLAVNCQLPIFVDCSLNTFNILRCSPCCRPSRMWIPFLIIFEAFMPHFCLFCTPCIAPESLRNHPNSFQGVTSKLNAKFNANSLLYSVILNVTVTQYTCSLNDLYCPH